MLKKVPGMGHTTMLHKYIKDIYTASYLSCHPPGGYLNAIANKTAKIAR